MKTFEIGKEYFSCSICDHNYIYTIKVLKRTAKEPVIAHLHHWRHGMTYQQSGIRF